MTASTLSSLAICGSGGLRASLESLPPAVKTALDKHAAKGKIAFVESVTKGGSVIAYEAKIKTAGKTSEIRLSPEGAAVKEP